MQVIMKGQETVLPKTKHEDDVSAHSNMSRMLTKEKETKEIIKQKSRRKKRSLICTSPTLMSILADLESS